MWRGGRSRPAGIKPVTRGAAATITLSVPLKAGGNFDAEGGALAPTQDAEQALHVEYLELSPDGVSSEEVSVVKLAVSASRSC